MQQYFLLMHLIKDRCVVSILLASPSTMSRTALNSLDKGLLKPRIRDFRPLQIKESITRNKEAGKGNNSSHFPKFEVTASKNQRNADFWRKLSLRTELITNINSTENVRKDI